MSTTELHRLTDELNEKIQEFEDELNELGLGVTAAVQFAGCPSRLAYVKRGGGFQLEVHELDLQNEDQETPLKSTSRETRLLAVHLFEPLFAALLLEVDNEHGRVLVAISTVENAIWRVRESGVERPDKEK